MSLAPGHSLLHYQLVEQIGAGGMGVVYRATDTKLRRDVAIKVLPDDFAKDEERLARFEREAHVLASLNHPGIASIHGIEESDGVRFLVLELIPGETLADRLTRGPLPVDEALPLARQIAEALDEAHERGIIHRDLKPANIKLTADGKVKVLDFGLAKAWAEDESDADLSHSPTLAAETHSGVILGTAGYMSPEQARGRPVDKRADIWAFGVVLFEMLSGRQCFTGETRSDMLASVLKTDPDMDALPADTPFAVRKLVERCLTKDPKRRLRDIGDARIDVLDLATESERFEAVAAATPPKRSQLIASVLGSLVLGVLATSLIFWSLKSTPRARDSAEHQPIRRYSINLSPDAPLRHLEPTGGGTDLALSPDGMLFVYVARTAPNQQLLFRRRLDQLDDGQPIAGTENAVAAFFSPDGQWIGFFTHDKLKKVSVQGGAPITLCDISAALGATWGEDGRIVFSSAFGEGLKRISAAGGPVENLMDESFMESQKYFMLFGPTILPGGKNVVFTYVANFSMNGMGIAALSLETGDVKFLLERAVGIAYHPTGHLVYAQEGSMMAAPFDPARVEITDAAVPVTEENMTVVPRLSFPVLLSFSNEGTLVYAPGSEDLPEQSVARTLVWVDREGGAEPLPAPPHRYSYVDLAPDGTRVAVLFTDPQDPFDRGDIWIVDLTREPITQQRLTFDPQAFYRPSWTPDSRKVVFGSLRDGAFSLSWMAANGTGPVESLHTSKNVLMASTWSADGRSLIFIEFTDQSNSDIWALSLDGERSAHRLMAESYNETDPAISPDGRWIAYSSNESGQFEVYVRPFPNVDDGKWLISTQGGESPIWAPDGRKLYYDAYPDKMMVVTIESEPAFAAGNPKVLFRGEYVIASHSGPDVRPYDISPDGQRFLMIKEDKAAREAAEAVAPPPITELVVVDNWDEVLKRITAGEGKP